MKIASISLQNFKSYRDHQKVTFGTDEHYITIFEGQMGHGKSNLLNAFYWCLFGQYWDSDKSMLIDDPNPTEVNLFNKGELLDGKGDGSGVNLFVEIEFYDDGKSKYTLKRSQSAHYINNAWKFDKDSKIYLEKIDALTGEYKRYSPDEAIGEVQRFFPRSLSNYFLFRGENRAQLVKLQGREEFQQALRELSKIEVFNRSEIHLTKVLDELRAELAAQASIEFKNQMEDILAQKKAAVKSTSEFEEEIAKLIKIEQYKKDEYDEYTNRIKENQAALEYQVKKEYEEKQVQDLQKQVQGLIETKQRELTKRWAAMGVFSVFEDIKTKYQAALNSGHYPPDISKSLIDKILKDMTCICGVHFKENSQAFEEINKLREVGSIDINLLQQVEKLMREIEIGEQLVKSFPNKIKEVDAETHKLLSEIKSKNITIKGYESKIGKIDFTLEELQRKQNEANDEYNKTGKKIVELRGWIETKRREIAGLEVEFQKLEGKLDKSNLPAIRVELAEKTLKAAKGLKREFETSIYNDLEKYTQENWEAIVYDKLNYDKVKLLRDSMYFEVYDKNGFPSRGSMNTGHSILLVLSFISALIKIAKQVWEEEFPLILDAPISEVGGSALPKALFGLGKIFNQTIVILKDETVTTENLKQIKEKVSKRYWIEYDKKRQHSKITALK